MDILDQEDEKTIKIKRKSKKLMKSRTVEESIPLKSKSFVIQKKRALEPFYKKDAYFETD